MNHQIDGQQKRENIAAKPEKMNALRDAQMTRKCSQLVAVGAILVREEGLSNNQAVHTRKLRSRVD
jgi:hypothetical protein